MIINGSNDIAKELNLKLTQASVNKNLIKNTKLNNFQDTFNKKLNNNLDNKREEQVDSYDDKIDKSHSTDKDTKDYDKKLDKLKNKLEKLKDKLDKLSNKTTDEDEKEISKEDVNDTINELISMINDLVSQLDGKDNSLNIQKDTSSINGVIDVKSPVLTDILNTKNSNLSSELKEIAKMLEPVKNAETLTDLSNIKSVIDELKELLQKNGKDEKGLENQEFKTNIINELKISLSNKSKEKENTNNTYKENSVSDDKNATSNNIKIETQNNESDSSNTFKGTDGNNKNSTSSEDKTIKKEESFLDSLVNDKDKNAINKFMPGTISKINTFEAALAKTGESAQSVNKANIAEGIVKNIKYMQANNLKELTVSMNPKDLGTMLIKISVEDGKLSAKIIAEKKETYELINSNATDVKNALGNVNDKVQQVSVNIQFGDATAYEQFKDGQGYQGNERRHTNSSDNLLVDEGISEDKIENDLYDDAVVNMLA